jgi:hypothetical protein
MDIKECLNLREKMAKNRELGKSIIKTISIIDYTEIPLLELSAGYRCNGKINETFFPKNIRKITKVVIFNFGNVFSWEATERMASLGFVPANIYEALVGINKLRGELHGMFFISGSPLDPEEVFTTFPMIKINGERIITLNVDLKTEERFFVGVESIKEAE